MGDRKHGIYVTVAKELMIGTPAEGPAVSPDPKGNRAQRRAWARLTKAKSTSDTATGTETP